MHVVFATPCYGGTISIETMDALDSFRMSLALRQNIVDRITIVDSHIDRARCVLVGKFVDREDATHLFFVDGDIGFYLGQAHQMIETMEEKKLPVIAADYALKDGSGNGTAQFVEPSEDGVVQCGYVGAGFMCIRREVIEECAKDVKSFNLGGVICPFIFHSSVNSSGSFMSEDYTFCDKVRAAGYAVYLDRRVKLTHYGRAAYHLRSADPNASAANNSSWAVGGL